MQYEDKVSKVPEVTLGFWVIKILATTLGETGGDSVTMTWLHADGVSEQDCLTAQSTPSEDLGIRNPGR